MRFIRDGLWAVNAVECQAVEIVLDNSGDFLSRFVNLFAVRAVFLIFQTMIDALFAE